jgi:hypothetical protein
MLIALTILILGLGGGSSENLLFPEDIIERVEISVVDENRQIRINNLVENINESINSYYERVKEIAENTSLINRNPDATEKDFEKVVQSLVKEREKLQKEIIEARLNMVDQFTVDEWKQVFLTDSVIKIE